MPPAPVARRKPALSPLRARRALAARLQAFRAWLGLTQQALAGAAGVSRATIARWEAGTCPMPAWLAGPMLDNRVRGWPKDMEIAKEAREAILTRSGVLGQDVLRAASAALDLGEFRSFLRVLSGCRA